MKRQLVTIFACMVVLLNLLISGAAQAQPLVALSIPGLQSVDLTEQQKAILEKLESDVLPQVQGILTTEQREKFTASVENGTSFRKAFKSLALTPDQKTQLSTLFKSLPTKDVFASLTPEQKKQFFTKKKELFMPTPEEIGDKISAKMKLAKDKAGSFMPDGAAIGEKISEKMKLGKSKVAE